VRALEGFRYTMLGEANAVRTLLFAAWHTLLSDHSDPIHAAQTMRDTWLASADHPPAFPGVDPAHLDAVSQEYRTAIDRLTAELLQIAQGLATERMGDK
jgi:hypothetical protein